MLLLLDLSHHRQKEPQELDQDWAYEGQAHYVRVTLSALTCHCSNGFFSLKVLVNLSSGIYVFTQKIVLY